MIDLLVEMRIKERILFWEGLLFFWGGGWHGECDISGDCRGDIAMLCPNIVCSTSCNESALDRSCVGVSC